MHLILNIFDQPRKNEDNPRPWRSLRAREQAHSRNEPALARPRAPASSQEPGALIDSLFLNLRRENLPSAALALQPQELPDVGFSHMGSALIKKVAGLHDAPQPAVEDDAHAVGEPLGLHEVVRHEHNRTCEEIEREELPGAITKRFEESKSSILAPRSYEPVWAPNQERMYVLGSPGRLRPIPQDPRQYATPCRAAVPRRFALYENHPYSPQCP